LVGGSGAAACRCDRDDGGFRLLRGVLLRRRVEDGQARATAIAAAVYWLASRLDDDAGRLAVDLRDSTQ
jgi:hypothetical protein